MTDDFIVLPCRLEEELHILDYVVKIMEDFNMQDSCKNVKVKQRDSIKSTLAYRIIEKVMQERRPTVRGTKLGEAFDKALKKLVQT